MVVKKTGIFIIPDFHREVYGQEEIERAGDLIEFVGPEQTPDVLEKNPGILAEVQVIMSTWGMTPLTPEFLAAAPKLEAVFYAAGSIRGFMTEEAWERGIKVCSSWQANAVPVAEFSQAMIVLCLKRAFEAQRVVSQGKYRDFSPHSIGGGYQARVGLVSIGQIARRVLPFLKLMDVEILAYDPFLDEETLAGLGLRKVTLEELFEQSDVVSLHTPALTETEGMINRSLLDRMKPHSAFINTARGRVVNLDDFVAFLRERPDVQAVVDVFDPQEPPPPDHPYFSLPNVWMTPHIAGAVGGERRRLAHYMLDELERYIAGEPLRYAISAEQSRLLA